MGGRSPGAGLTGKAQVSLTALNGQDVMATNQHSMELEMGPGRPGSGETRGASTISTPLVGVRQEVGRRS